MELIEIRHGDFVNIEGALRIQVSDNELYVRRPDRVDKYALSGSINDRSMIYHQIKEVQKRNGSI